MNLFKWLFDKRKKRVFISFAREDTRYRDFLVEQAKRDNSPFYFIDMSVKKAWKQNKWKKRCRTKIKACDGVIILLSKKTIHAEGVRWEISCAKEESIPLTVMHIQKNNKGIIPVALRGENIINWNWENLDKFINKL